MTPFSVTQCEKSWKTPYRHKMTYMDIKQILWRGRARFDFYSQGLSGIKTKWRLAVITAMLIAVPATTALNPCRGKLPLHLFTACGKNNKTSICASKQDFFFNPNTAVIQKSLLPLLLSLHFLDPTSHPSQGHVHPVACWPCFFPFRVLDFFFPLCGFRLCKCCKRSKVVMDTTVPHISLGWKGSARDTYERGDSL